MAPDTLTVNLFGSFRLEAGGQSLRSIRIGERRDLFMYLCMTADTRHDRRMLARLIWPTSDDADGQRLLRQALYRLRMDLDERAIDGALLQTDRTTAAVNPALVRLDVRRFTQVWEQIERHDHREISSCRDCTARLREMQQIYCGPLTETGGAGADQTPLAQWFDQQRRQLEAIALRMWHLCCEVEAAQGNHGRVLTVAEAWLAAQPWDEAALRYVMRSHALLGDRNAALAAFRRGRRALQRELNTEPELTTFDLASAIRSGRIELLGQPRSTAGRDNQELFGREEPLNRLVDALLQQHGRLVTIVGMSGAGKTALAAAAVRLVRREFVDGIISLSLQDLRHADELPRRLAQALNLRADGLDLFARVIRVLARRRMLIVLDSAEALAGAGTALRLLIDEAPQVRLLTTSRIPLQIDGEWLLRLSGLPLPPENWDGVEPMPPAVRMLVRRLETLQPQYRPSAAELVVLAELVRKVGALPFALEVAAENLQHTTPRQLIGSIQRLARGDAPTDQLVGYQRQVNAILDASWQLLSPAERSIAAQAAIFRSPFDMVAAHAVIQMPEQARSSLIDVLFGLVDRTLLQIDSSGRYFWHRLVQHYAVAQLQETGMAAGCAQRHADYFLRRAVVHVREICRPPFSRRRALAELNDLHGAWHTALAAVDGQLINEHLGAIFELLVLLEEIDIGSAMARAGIEQLEQSGVGLLDEQRLALLIRLLTVQSRFAYLAAQNDEALALCRRAEALVGGLSDSTTRAGVLAEAGLLALFQADYRSARDYLRSAVDLLPLPGRAEMGETIVALLMHAEFEVGNFAEAERLTQQMMAQTVPPTPAALNTAVMIASSLAICKGDIAGSLHVLERLQPQESAQSTDWKIRALLPWIRGNATTASTMLRIAGTQMPAEHEWPLLFFIGTLALRFAELDIAEALLRLALERRRSSGGLWSRQAILCYLARVQLRRGETEQAAATAQEAYRLSLMVGNRLFTAYTAMVLAETLQASDAAQAIGLLQQALTIWDALGRDYGAAEARIALAEIALLRNKQADALTAIEPVLAADHPYFWRGDEPARLARRLLAVLQHCGDARYPAVREAILARLHRAADVADDSLRVRILMHPDSRAIAAATVPSK